MRIPAVIAIVGTVAFIGGALPAAKSDADVFEFVPPGGRTLLAQVLAGKPVNDPSRALVATTRSAEQWRAWLKGEGASIPGVRALDERGRATLADYLAHNMPLAAGKAPANPSAANWEKALPLDGRDLVLEHCQSCHIITVVVTQDRSKAAWLGTMNKPSHVGIRTTPAQREALADYLIVNAGIPIDQVPEELRAGGATY